MSKWIFEERGRALEEAFFQKKERELIKNWQKSHEKATHLDSLRNISGIKDDSLLTKMIEIGVTEETWAALNIIPLVEMAWIDGILDPKKRETLLSAMKENGLTESHPAYQLLESWLGRKPDAVLFETWGQTIQALKLKMSQEEFKQLKKYVLIHVNDVMKTSKGLFGMNEISQKENLLKQKIEKVFEH
jgi:hypothetical protein